jgi:cupin 2 domain-containing protein
MDNNQAHNIYSSLPTELKGEVFDDLLRAGNVRVERIISPGHTSADKGWYDQEDNEWVIVLQGAGTILFAAGEEVTLKEGDYLNIPAHAKHKVTWTQPNDRTIWLAIHYS